MQLVNQHQASPGQELLIMVQTVYHCCQWWMENNYAMNNITRSSNGTYRCTADNGVDGPVNRIVRVTVRCEYLSYVYNLNSHT